MPEHQGQNLASTVLYVSYSLVMKIEHKLQGKREKEREKKKRKGTGVGSGGRHIVFEMGDARLLRDFLPFLGCLSICGPRLQPKVQG